MQRIPNGYDIDIHCLKDASRWERLPLQRESFLWQAYKWRINFRRMTKNRMLKYRNARSVLRRGEKIAWVCFRTDVKSGVSWAETDSVNRCWWDCLWQSRWCIGNQKLSVCRYDTSVALSRSWISSRRTANRMPLYWNWPMVLSRGFLKSPLVHLYVVWLSW